MHQDSLMTTRDAVVTVPPPLVYQRCRLSVVDGPDRGKSIETERAVVRVGSQSDNDIVLTDPAVSRHHFEVHKRTDGYAIMDVGSTNGTYVGPLCIKDALITRRSEIRIGDSSLLLEPLSTELVITPSTAYRCGGLVGSSQVMREIFTMIERVAPTELPVLVTGATGTGKDMVARAIHDISGRGASPFVTLDCSSLPPTLIEAALFGHEATRPDGSVEVFGGVFERAHGGTLYLDELAELPITLQPKLLRAIERGEVQRLNATQAVRVDVRVVASSNRELSDMVQAGTFRGDLYYRLAVVRIRLPELRDRIEDLTLLIDDFFERYGPRLREQGALARSLGAGALAALRRYSYPGNVRELINVLRRAMVLAESEEIVAEDLPEDLKNGPPIVPSSSSSVPIPDASVPFKDAKASVVDAFQKEYLQSLLQRHNLNISKAAREAGIDRRHLYRLLERYEIQHGRAEAEVWRRSQSKN